MRTVNLPTRLRCVACGLRLESHAELHAAALGAQFTKIVHLDPRDYYGMIYESDLYEDDYMNE